MTLVGGGAVRPEKRVTARSKLPQKKCTGLTLPMKRARNSFITRAACNDGLVKARSVFGVVLRVAVVLVERNGVCDFARHGPNVNVDAEAAQPLHECGIEIGDRHRREREAFHAAVAGGDAKLVAGQIEDDIERAVGIRVRRRDEAARVHVQSDVPPMIDQRRQLEPHFAGDLRPAKQRFAGVAPGRERQVRPKRMSGHRIVLDGAVRARDLIVLARSDREENP